MAGKLTKTVKGDTKIAATRKTATKTKADGRAAASKQAVTTPKPQTDSLAEGAKALARAQGAKAIQTYQEELNNQWDEFLQFAGTYSAQQSADFITGVEEFYGVEAIAADPNSGVEIIEGSNDGQPG